MSKSVFFLSPSHTGHDSGFSSKIGRIPTRLEWLDNLKLALNVVTAFAQYIFHSFVHLFLQSSPTKFSKSRPAEVV